MLLIGPTVEGVSLAVSVLSEIIIHPLYNFVKPYQVRINIIPTMPEEKPKIDIHSPAEALPVQVITKAKYHRPTRASDATLQDRFIQAYEENGGLKYQAAQAAHISIEKVNNWLKDEAEGKASAGTDARGVPLKQPIRERIKQADDRIAEQFEAILHAVALGSVPKDKKPNVLALIYWLNHRGGARYQVEQQQAEALQLWFNRTTSALPPPSSPPPSLKPGDEMANVGQ